MPSSLLSRGHLLLALVAAALPIAPAAAQERVEGKVSYRREVFEYHRAGRPDPFRAPARPTAERLPLGELVLRGVLYDPDPRIALAILTAAGRERPVRARAGERIGGVRVLAIHPRRVELLVEEGGTVRRESLHLSTSPGAPRETP